MQDQEHNDNGNGATVDVKDASDFERMLADYEASDYVEAVVELAEQSERNYRAAVMAGNVVHGFSDSTNY